MRSLLLLVSLLLPGVVFSQAIVPFPDGIRTRDHGRERTYVIAADEIAQPGPSKRFEVRSQNVAQAAAAKTLAPDARLIVYPSDEKRSESNRRLLTEKVLVHLQPGTDASSLARRLGFEKSTPAPALADHYVFTASSSRSALTAIEALRSADGVVSADHLLARLQKRRGIPNDPLFRSQWFLRNNGQTGGKPGIDAGVAGIWGKFGGAGIRGRGVLVGIVDDGVQGNHPDLKANYDSRLDYDWNDNTPYTADPSQNNEDFHGTAVAGIVAARGGNKLGVCGVAPQARITGLRLIADYVDDSQEAEAFLFRPVRIAIKSNSWGPYDDGQSLEGPGPLAQQALIDATTNGRNGHGTIFVFAAGNGRTDGDNSNYDGYANSIYTIATTAVDHNGKVTYYGEGGANVVIAAPSDNYADSGIVTTDLTGNNGYNYFRVGGDISLYDYTGTFGGTSAAAPVVSGVVALMLQRNPNLGWRDVQEILIRTAMQNDPGNVGWITNGAGFHFNEDFGAGLVRGTDAVNLGAHWQNLGPQTSQSISDTNTAAIPDGTGSLMRTFTFDPDQRVEHVTVKLDVTHPKRGQLRITLISPSGTVSELATKHNDPNSDIDWTYMTVRNWGEDAGGEWTLKIEDLLPGSAGTFNSAEVTLYGSDQLLMTVAPL